VCRVLTSGGDGGKASAVTLCSWGMEKDSNERLLARWRTRDENGWVAPSSRVGWRAVGCYNPMK
jgi:hypothetical protein